MYSKLYICIQNVITFVSFKHNRCVTTVRNTYNYEGSKNRIANVLIFCRNHNVQK